MALTDKINTAKEVLGNTRSRMVVVILAIIVVVVLIVAFVKFKKSNSPPSGLESAVTTAPNISSIPGLGNPTREYAKLQEQQNADLVAQAERDGTSAIPTLVRTTYLDSGVSDDQIGASSAEGCGVEELKRARASGVTAAELRCRGCSIEALKAAGYNGAELKAAGFSVEDLKNAGFSAAELRAAGFSAEDLKNAGFSASELRNAGFTAAELAKAGFTSDELKAAGYSDDEIKNATSFDSGVCNAKNLQEVRSNGTSAADLRKLGCNAEALKAVGYTAAELKAAGFSAAELKAAGFSAKDLKDVGFSAAELKAAGFSAKDLSDAGFTPDELLAAGYTKGDLARAGVLTADSITGGDSSCSVESLKKSRAQGKNASEMKSLGCSAAALKTAGYTAAELKDAGFSAAELKAAGFSAKELANAGFSPDEINAVGFPPEDVEGTVASAGAVSKQKTLAKNVKANPFSGVQNVIARMNSEEMAGMSHEEIKSFLNQQQALMTLQANKLFTAWTPVSTQQYVMGTDEKDKEGAGKKPELTEEQKKQEMLKNSDVYKAGTILFAVLDTGVNSDETTPVMATVVQGPLKGSKVIGNFQRVDQKVLLQFSVLSVPKLDASVSINAVAIEPNTAKTAMSSDVDNHYMLRYGTLFASSFISGIGEAFQTAGSKSTTTTTGSVTTLPELNAAQKVMVGLGNVGQQFGTAMSSKVNMPPTVKVNAGISIGLLLMADLPVPKNNRNKNGDK